MLATSSQRLSWRDNVSFGLWRLVQWAVALQRTWQLPPVAMSSNPQEAPVPAVPLVIDGVEYVDIGRRFPIRADRLDYFYRAVD